MPTLAVDFGGTLIKLGIVEHGRPLATSTLPAHADGGLASRLPAVERGLRELCGARGLAPRECVGLGISFPATVDHRHNRVLDEFGKYADAMNIDLPRWARERLGLPLTMDSDGRLAAIGEWQHGAGQGCDSMVAMVLGTGIGTGAIVEGRVLRGRSGQAGILGGHQTIDSDGPLCYCGNVGCAEAIASVDNAMAQVRALPGYDASPLRELPRVDFVTLFEVARDGDPVATRAVDWVVAKWAAVAVNLIHAYTPERLVIGGGIMRSADLILPRIRSYVQQHALTPKTLAVEVVAAQLGGDSALAGADWLVRQVLEGTG
jgi:glucokinase